jgi:uncharacterized protein
MNHHKERKLQLEYPCPWIYKIIGTDEDQMRSAAAEIIRDRSYSISASHNSVTSRYHCLNVELLVESEEHRKAIYEAFKASPSVKVIL